MKKLFKKGVVAAACAAAMLAGYGSAHAESYSFTDLGDLSRALYGSNYKLQQPENKAFGINDSGQVVGILKGQFTVNGTTWTSQTHIIRWDIVGTSNTTATDLYSGTGKIFGYDINNSGVIVGNYQSNSKYYAFQYNPGTKVWNSIGVPSDGVSVQSVPTAINNSGQIVGYAGNQAGPNAQNTAFIYSGGTIKDIPGATVAPPASSPNSNNSSAAAINNNGLVTGYSTVNGIARAFVYDSSVGTAAGFTTLGTLGGLATSTSYGTGINDSGNIVGYSTTAGGIQHAFLYTMANGTMIDLGALGGAGNTSQANAINNNGVIVGTSNNHAFIYENNHMYDLNNLVGLGAESSFTLTTATGINNLGQIIGYGTNAAGEERAFALTVTPTPIPAALPLFASGLAALGVWRRRFFTA